MHLPAQNYAPWQAMTLMLHATGVLFSLYRLQERFRTSRLWWDDYIACVPLTFNIIFVVATWMRLSVLRGLSGHERLTPEQMSQAIHSYWMSLFLYFTVLWFSRISLALSLVRTYPKQDSRRRVAVIMIWVFAIVYLLAITVPIVTCPGPWYYVAMDRCIKEKRLGYISGIVVFAFDVVADVALVLLPIYWLRKTDLKPRLRRIMVMAFCASFLSLLAAINYAIFYFSGIDFGVDRRLITAMITHIQTGIAVIVCNFLVVTMKLYRKANNNSDDDGDGDEGDSSCPDDVISRRFRYGTDNLTVPASIISSTQDFVMRNLTNRHGNRRSRSNRHPYMMRTQPPIAEDKQPSPFSSSSLPVITTSTEATTTMTIKSTTSLSSAGSLKNQNAPAPHDAQVATNQMSNPTTPTHDPSVAHTELGVQRPLSVHLSTIKNHSKSAPG